MTTNVESLLARAYEGLIPSPEVGEEVRAGLRGPRAEPSPRRRRWSVAAALLAGALLALVWPRGGGSPAFLAGDAGTEVILPEVAAPPQPPECEAVPVRLARGGRILVRLDELEGKWAQVSLEGLAAYLRRAARRYDERMRETGGSGYDELPGGAKATRLAVDLHSDREAPWRHLQWVMTVLAEEGFMKVRFAVRAPEKEALLLDATLPTDLPPETREGRAVIASVTLRMSGKGPEAKPLYRFGDREARELSEVAKWLETVRKEVADSGAEPRGSIKASGGVRHEQVTALLAEFQRCGFRRVDFYGTKPLQPAQREALGLPDVAEGER